LTKLYIFVHLGFLHPEEITLCGSGVFEGIHSTRFALINAAELEVARRGQNVQLNGPGSPVHPMDVHLVITGGSAHKEQALAVIGLDHLAQQDHAADLVFDQVGGLRIGHKWYWEFSSNNRCYGV